MTEKKINYEERNRKKNSKLKSRVVDYCGTRDKE